LTGQTISHYRILDKLGEGGMGVVYKAEDTKLEREVALKFLAAHLLNDKEAKQRFLREAKSAAALHHPNICTVHEIDEAEGRTFLAMAFLEGETLEDRIAQGPLPLKDALDIGRQVAEGLQAAHAAGVVHRDIKPANILIPPEGRATIMDFGLARLAEASKLTRQDQTVGTAAYMSPEQIQGGEIDQRTDIWALGCVLYEMVAGVRPFPGQYDQALAYEIVNQDPEPLTGVRAGVPMELEVFVGKCLAKDPVDRYGSADELAKDLRTLAEKLKSGRSTVLRTGQETGPAPTTMSASQTVSPVVEAPRLGSLRLWQALAGVLAAALIGVLSIYAGGGAPDGTTATARRFSFSHEGIGHANISPDGRYIAFTAMTQDGVFGLWLRSLDSETVRELPGTQGAYRVPGDWSPDSRSILFATSDQLKRVAIDGGEPTVLCSLPAQGYSRFLGAAHSLDGDRIVFSHSMNLWEIPARGGDPNLLVPREGNSFYWRPQFLPNDGGSRYLIYTVSEQSQRRTELFDVQTGERRSIAPGGNGRFVGDGFLIHGGPDRSRPGLFATPFSLEDLSATGDPFPISESGVSVSSSEGGTIVFADRTEGGTDRIVIRNRTGEVVGEVGDTVAAAKTAAVSPDGTKVAFRADSSVWVYDLSRDVRVRLNAGENALAPSWMPSGRDVVFRVPGEGFRVQAADASSAARLWLGAPAAFGGTSLSVDGRFVAYGENSRGGDEGGIFYREVNPDGSLSDPVPWLVTPASENAPAFSPDGRHLAYNSNESGVFEIYVRPFPEGEAKWLVSTDGGWTPVWSSGGTELFYWKDDKLLSVQVSTGDGLAISTPQPLFESPYLRGSSYDAFPDGERFVMIEANDEAVVDTVRIIDNWASEFSDRER
jgi:Tol biopolymer transport system component/tRNA A-37 threonylcarbamoyl transferase component Bud32